MDRGEEEDVSDVFAIPDFWKSSRWLESSADNLRLGTVFDVDVNSEPPQHLITAVPEQPSGGYFGLPPLLELPSVPSVQTEFKLPRDEHLEDEVGDLKLVLHDLWIFQEHAIPKQPEIRTWAEFDKDDATESAGTLMTEASSAAFDALLAAKDNPFTIPDNDKYRNVGSGAYFACLLALALGRSSMLFAWDDHKSSFVATLAHLKLQGYSGQILEGINNACKECGESTRYLRSFVDKIYVCHASPARTALANAVDKLLLTIQSELGLRGEQVRSLLQLQAVIQPVRSILIYFKGLVKRLSRSRSDEQLISMLFEEANSVEYRDDFLRTAVCEVLRMVSKPWTDFVEEWIGLKSEEGIVMSKSGPGKSFVKVENKMWVDDQGFELQEPDYFIDEEAMPSFVPEDVAQEIFETGRNLRFIRANHPEHRLARADYIAASKPPKLEWQFDWEAITRVENNAKEYEEALLRLLERSANGTWKDNSISGLHSKDKGFEFQFFGKDESQIAASVHASIRLLDGHVAQKATAEDGLRHILEQQLLPHALGSTLNYEPDFKPHWSLLPLLSFGPIVAAQAEVINRECTNLLFTAHDIRSHFHLQRQYHLLGNGLFSSRLSHALFDPELNTAERKSGIALTGGVMGLRLSGRENWPPASSELRLALMGVLAESYEQPPWQRRQSSQGPRGRTVELPGDMDISFAVRDLSPEEIEKCINPNSLEALDFLRLSYKPPSALLPIMTPVILLKYDRIFRLLLRILRMLYVVNQLFCDIVIFPQSHCGSEEELELLLRFRAEAHHFVTRLAAYLFDVGVSEAWRRFEDWLDVVERDLSGSLAGERLTSYGGPDRLRERHEQTLDEIMAAVLLRKRQAPVMKLLEEIFGAVLLFAKCVQGQALAGGDEAAEIKRLYGVFKKKVEIFTTVCRGMSEKGGGGGSGQSSGPRGRGDEGGRRQQSGQAGEENSILRLLLMLDMSGYFTRKTGA